MSSKYINNSSYASTGYTCSGLYRSITIGPKGRIGGPGLVGFEPSNVDQAYTILNLGTIDGGIGLSSGGTVGGVVTNGASGLIEGGRGVFISAGSGTVVNAGRIEGATLDTDGSVYLEGGLVANTGTAALIEGYNGVVATGECTVSNAGTIKGIGKAADGLRGSGVDLEGTGVVRNLAGGLIEGSRYGVQGDTVINAGTIEGTGGGGGVLADLVTNGAAGLIEGARVGVDGGNVTNAGTIDGTGSSGIGVNAGVSVANLARGLIEGGYSGVVSVDTVNNAGTITGRGSGVYQSYTVINSGTIEGTGGGSSGVSFDGYGGANRELTNDARGLIEGGESGVTLVDTVANAGIIDGGRFGVTDAYLVTNTGTIDGTGTDSIGVSGNGARNADVDVVNGSRGLIEAGRAGISLARTVANAGAIEGGFYGVFHADTVSNSGTIEGGGTSGVVILAIGTYTSQGLSGGVVTNRGTAALIEGGQYGVEFVRSPLSGLDTVANSGTIEGTDSLSSGVFVLTGGILNNRGTASLIEGGEYGIRFGTANPLENRIANAGTIEGTGRSSDGIILTAGLFESPWGTITNGTGALIAGGNSGIVVNASTAFETGTVSNGGTIEGRGSSGIVLLASGIVINSGTAALIEGGKVGVEIGGPAGTVVNFGTIAAAGGTSVLCKSEADLLVDESGAVFVGNVVGGGGTLELLGTHGSFQGLGTQFTDFSSVRVLGHASWTFDGPNLVAEGADLSVLGTLVNAGTLSVLGSATLEGIVSGAGTIDIRDGATVAIGGIIGEHQTVGFATSGGSLELDRLTGFNATVRGFAAGDSLDLAALTFGAATTKLSYSGSPSTSGGTLTVTDGSHRMKLTLFGQYAAAGFQAASDGHGGTLVTYVPPPAPASLANAG